MRSWIMFVAAVAFALSLASGARAQEGEPPPTSPRVTPWDAAIGYRALTGDYKHQAVDHHIGEYARGRVSTNGIENFWALLKRSLHGTYVAVDEAHLWRYVDERVFAFNLRDLTDLERFQTVLRRIAGRRLTWTELTA